MNNKRMESCLAIIIILVVICVAFFVCSLLFQVSWNIVIPDVTNEKLSSMSYLQAVALMVVLSIVGWYFRGSKGKS